MIAQGKTFNVVHKGSTFFIEEEGVIKYPVFLGDTVSRILAVYKLLIDAKPFLPMIADNDLAYFVSNGIEFSITRNGGINKC